MRLPFGLELRRAATSVQKAAGPLAGVSSRGGWVSIIRDWYAGAWQKNDEWTTESVLAFHAVFSCITLIASDIGKLRPKIVEFDANAIWTETKSSAFSPVMRKPNPFQNHIQFKEWWMVSKLIHGNTYALKVRDGSRIVRQLYLLDPSRVEVLVAPNGSVFYRLREDNLSGLHEGSVTVPASEIIHDRINCLFHPLVGLSPIYACGIAANAGLKIQSSSSRFFSKGALPSGVLTAPTAIDDDERDAIAEHWNTMFSGDHAGAVAVLGSNLKFEAMRMTSVDAQLIEQLKWNAETVCSTFHVPPFKLGIGPAPTYANAAEAENGKYYSDCLQAHIESFELVMDEGLGIGEGVPLEHGKILGVELDLDGLIRMDTGTQIKTLSEGIGGSLLTVNEARKKIDKKPLQGGDTVYMQQQNYSLEALAERDKDKPFSKPTTPPPGAPGNAPPPTDDTDDDEEADAEERALKIRGVRALFRELVRAA